MRYFFSKLSIFDMTEQELFFDDLHCELNKAFVFELIKNNRAVKFNNIIVSKSFKTDYKYRITFFDNTGIIAGHCDRKTIIEITEEVFEFIPHEQKYVLPDRIIN